MKQGPAGQRQTGEVFKFHSSIMDQTAFSVRVIALDLPEQTGIIGPVRLIG